MLTNFSEAIAINIPFADKLKELFSSFYERINIFDVAFSQIVKEKLSLLITQRDFSSSLQKFIFWASEHLIATSLILILTLLLLSKLNKQQPKKLVLGNLKNELNQLYLFLNNSGNLSVQQIEDRQNQIEKVLARVEFAKNYMDLVEGKAGSYQKGLMEINNLAEEIRTRLYIMGQKPSTNITKKNKGRLPFGL